MKTTSWFHKNWFRAAAVSFTGVLLGTDFIHRLAKQTTTSESMNSLSRRESMKAEGEQMFGIRKKKKKEITLKY